MSSSSVSMRAGVGVGVGCGSVAGDVRDSLDVFGNMSRNLSYKIWKFLPMYCKSFASSSVTLLLSHSSGVSTALPRPGMLSLSISSSMAAWMEYASGKSGAGRAACVYFRTLCSTRGPTHNRTHNKTTGLTARDARNRRQDAPSSRSGRVGSCKGDDGENGMKALGCGRSGHAGRRPSCCNVEKILKGVRSPRIVKLSLISRISA